MVSTLEVLLLTLRSRCLKSEHRIATQRKQRRHVKTISSIEKSLMDARDSSTSMKFAGNLAPMHGSSSELGKERFISHLKLLVQENGQETFYFVCDSDGKASDLFENAHYFKLEDVINISTHDPILPTLETMRNQIYQLLL